MNFQNVFSQIFLFLMLMDPFGNLPVFVSILRKQDNKRYKHIILRESGFALIGMIGTLALGRLVMNSLHISNNNLGVAGGLILLIIGLKMVFSTFSAQPDEEVTGEPFIVPLAIPLICGPGLIAMLVTSHGNVSDSLAALLLAWLIQMTILFFGKTLAAILGNKMLDALESLMGLLLTAIAVGMIFDAVNRMYRIGGM